MTEASFAATAAPGRVAPSSITKASGVSSRMRPTKYLFYSHEPKRLDRVLGVTDLEPLSMSMPIDKRRNRLAKEDCTIMFPMMAFYVGHSSAIVKSLEIASANVYTYNIMQGT